MPPEHAASTGLRTAAAIGGAVALLLACVLTLGTGLFALAGIGVAAVVARQNGKRLTMLSSWLGAAIGVAAALLLGSATLAIVAPPGTWSEVKQAMDSASAEADREIIANAKPGTEGMAAVGTKAGTAIGIWMLAVGAMLTFAFLASLAGTLAWLALLPLHFAYAGRWMWAVDPP